MNRRERIEIGQLLAALVASTIVGVNWGLKYAVLVFCAACLFSVDASWNRRGE
ncbi:MAG: hypothetical protein LUO93_02150 [Methanomicrobiales archaeon]|nr:hypothetical protein [Methanomicrobiales archaeon]